MLSPTASPGGPQVWHSYRSHLETRVPNSDKIALRAGISSGRLTSVHVTKRALHADTFPLSISDGAGGRVGRPPRSCAPPERGGQTVEVIRNQPRVIVSKTVQPRSGQKVSMRRKPCDRGERAGAKSALESFFAHVPLWPGRGIQQHHRPWHRLYFMPLPHGHSLFREFFGNGLYTARLGSGTRYSST